MDRPVPDGVTIHYVDYNRMGVMVSLNYKPGDWVNYGGMLYKPETSGSNRLIFQVFSSHPRTVKTHYAEIWNRNGMPLFYCS